MFCFSSVSLKPFLKAKSALIGQLAQFVVIGQPLRVFVGNPFSAPKA